MTSDPGPAGQASGGAGGHLAVTAGPELGVVYPQTEIGTDAATVRRYALEVEALGFAHLVVYDHVLGADKEVHQGWSGYYDSETTFHEPMVLFGYLAALTSLELVTGILVLPQRQTALVAKQAAEVDILSNGRLRLGVGIGWNSVEYEALGKKFTDRGRRIEEQVELLRRLWTEPSITYLGHDELVTGAGICPPPLQRPIPVWFGGDTPAACRRAGRLGDGWMPDHLAPGPELAEARAILDEAAREAGRDPSAIGMQARIRWGRGGVPEVAPGELQDLVLGWRDAGATHVALSTMDAGLRQVEGHLEVLRSAAAELGLEPAASA